MPEQEKRIEKRSDLVKMWLKQPSNLVLVTVLAFVIILRLYYFFLTINQPLWWDESEYMASAKGYAGIIDYKLESIRLPGFPLFVSLFYTFGITSEAWIRFFVLFIPSIILLLLTYFIIKEMYPDRKIALISIVILSVLWEHLFYSNRFHTENLALIFEFLAILVLFRSYIKRQNLSFIKPKYSLLLIILLSIISPIFRPANSVFIPGFFLFLIFINKSKIFNKKNIIFFLIAVVLIFIPVFYALQAPKTGILYALNLTAPLAWNVLNVFSGFYASVVSWIPPLFFYSFILGVLVAIIGIYIYFPKLKHMKNDSSDLEFKSDVFNMLILMSVLGSFIFILRTYTGFEYRWFFPLLPPMLAFTSKGTIVFSNFLGKLIKSKYLSVFLIVLICSLGAYTQFIHADSIIRIKLNSYSQIKDSSLWIKENSQPNDVILSRSIPQTAYYSERKVYPFSSDMNESQFLDFVEQTRPKYVLESIFQGNVAVWIQNPSENMKKTLIPVKIWFLDSQQQQPAVILYQVNPTQN